ncbi:amino-acid N-acetyltransferase [Methylophilaceae bacterium]|nr:amino-acid N-acetyltransferase [Methylophilaceae bacterium]
MQNNTGNIIRQKRKERGLTLNTLANKLNISASNLSRIETGALKVSANLINQLVGIFKVSPQYFFNQSSVNTSDATAQSSFIQNFRLSAKYINLFNQNIFVIALSGYVFNEDQFEKIAQDINLLHSLKIKVILVYGARPQVESILVKNKIPVRLVKNMRVTSSAALKHVIEVNGAIRIKIEATLSTIKSVSEGMHLSSGNFLTAMPVGIVDGIDMESTGKIRGVDVEAIKSKLNHHEIVIVSPIGYSPIGQIFNLSYEQTAANIAAAINADKLIYYVDANGILNERGELIPELTSEKAQKLISHIEEKPSPESTQNLSYDDFNILKSSVFAIKNKIKKVHLINRHIDGSLIEELFTEKGSGTILTEFALENFRKATEGDIKDIYRILFPLERRKILIERDLTQIKEMINQFYVLEHDKKFVGCVSLNSFKESLELASFSIEPKYQRVGFGKKLLKFCELEAKKLKYDEIFILTTQSEHWFAESGFKEKSKELMPTFKKKTYQSERNSKYLTKKL